MINNVEKFTFFVIFSSYISIKYVTLITKINIVRLNEKNVFFLTDFPTLITVHSSMKYLKNGTITIFNYKTNNLKF